MTRDDLRPWLQTGVFLTVCILAVIAVSYWRARTATDPAWLLQTLPEQASVHFVADLNILRAAGLLDLADPQNAKQDPDYARFIADTAFDYRKDLNTVAAAFKDGDLYVAAQGQFAFDRLAAYAQAQHGGCANNVCQMPASRPGRNISFTMLKSGVLGLAVSAQPLAVATLKASQWKTPPHVPSTTPLWISAPGTSFSEVNALPAGTHAFLSPLRRSQGAIFTVSPSGPSAIELHMEASAASASAAGDIVTELTATTDLLKKMLDRDKLKPKPDDLISVLTSGRFQTQGPTAQGAWQIDRKFLETLSR